ncbi:MAG: Crp/Fnr family transcriptional regulator [Spirochaetes bacterium]|nr:Crp/Fnr family transcriptional regulator [Spirochaetota bacterium]
MINTIDKNTEKLFSVVKGNYYLQSADDNDIRQLIQLSNLKTYSKGSYVFMEGEEVSAFYIVITGKIEINMNNHKFSEKIFNILGPGHLLGLSEIFNCHGIYTTNALCEKDCTLAAISKNNFHSMIEKLPSLAHAICMIMGNMIGELRQELSLSNAEVKVMSYLKSLMSDSGVLRDGCLYIPRHVTYDKLSKMLNITRETTSRVFKNLKERKIIDVFKNSYKIININAINSVVPDYSCLSHYHDFEDDSLLS